MAIKKRPGFQTNVDRSVRGTQKRSVYFDIKPGQKVRLRFTPVSNEDGSIFFQSSQHFKFLSGGEKRAYACLRYHGGTDCPICDALEMAKDLLGSTGESLVDKHGVSHRWHGQVVPIVEGENPEQTFIVGLSRTTADSVNEILSTERDNQQPLLTDPEEGQIIQINRNTASGFGTRYKVMPTGVRVNLDEFFPGWEEKFLNVEEAINLRIEKPEVLIASMKETFGDAVYSSIETALNTQATE